MLLETIKDFDWFNEPQNVAFAGNFIKILSLPNTDFWQSNALKRDNGHFFYKPCQESFELVTGWQITPDNCCGFNQCGCMVRHNLQNWLKISIMAEDQEHLQIGTCVTVNGCSDWAMFPLDKLGEEIFFKIKKNGETVGFYFSADGKNFTKIRMTTVKLATDLFAGAYVCAPQSRTFAANLKKIEIL